MGKKRGSSWFAVVRRAFCSPTKGYNKKNTRKRGETEQQDQVKARRVSREANVNQTTQYHHNQEKIDQMYNKDNVTLNVNQTRALAVAEAAAATAQAAAEVVRLTRRSTFIRECCNSAIVIQAAFRGYLARRALTALKGIVKLQAFIRGNNVRKQAKLNFRCVQALSRLQAQMCDRQARLSHDRCRKSMFAESNNLWDRYKQDVRQRKSTSAGRCSSTDEWDFFPCIIEDDETVFKSRTEAALKREKALAYALSQQLSRFNSDINSRSEWLNRWMATRGSNERRDSIRTVHVDTVEASQPNKAFLSQSRHSLSHSPSLTPCSCQTKPLQVRSASHSTANTPSSGSKYSCNSDFGEFGAATTPTTPHYMAATESAKAKARSLSMLNQRPSTPGRERVRKRLSYPATEQCVSDYTDGSSFSQCLRSPSFKSVCPALKRGAYDPSSYYGEISPTSATHIRRWLN